MGDYFLGVYTVLWNTPIGSVTISQPDISRMVMAIPKFLVFQVLWSKISQVVVMRFLY